MSSCGRETEKSVIPLRLATAVAIVSVVHISVIVFVFLRTIREAGK
jgi:hypothetical protein